MDGDATPDSQSGKSIKREERSENIITSDGRDRRRENGEGSRLRGNDKGTLTHSVKALKKSLMQKHEFSQKTDRSFRHNSNVLIFLLKQEALISD